MSRKDLGYFPLLVVLAAAWGSSYLFIKVAIADLEPAALMAIRFVLAAAIVAIAMGWRLGARSLGAQLWRTRRACVVLGAVNLAIPTWLVAWGEQRIASGTAAIAQATAPLFVLLIGLRLLPEEPVTAARVLGLGAGTVGVALLVAGQPGSQHSALVGVLAVVASSLAYAVGAVYIRRFTAHVDLSVVVVGELVVAACLLLPFAFLQRPTTMPSLETVASVVGLTLIGTVLGQLVVFRMLRLYGAGRVSLVTYLMPAFALVFGGVLLDEHIGPLAVAGLVLILGGVALAGWRPRSAAALRTDDAAREA